MVSTLGPSEWDAPIGCFKFGEANNDKESHASIYLQTNVKWISIRNMMSRLDSHKLG